ncbi:MAG: hypothetical protein WC826_00735 [Microgenomates group bacterium]|jgi:hypothetical protein
MRQTARLGENASDIAWLVALGRIGISEKTILTVWDTKEEESRKSKNSDIS